MRPPRFTELSAVERVDPVTDLSDRLRDRILNALHLGTLHPGDRLPSIRALWRELGVDHRVVAQAYRVLEAEGLVEVRGRSGVYLAPQDELGGELLAETARWMNGVLVEAWKRRIGVRELPDLVRLCTSTRRTRVAVVESNADQMTAYCGEMEEDFGVESVAVRISPVPLPRPERSVEFHSVEDVLRTVDFVVTTSYHSRLVRKAAENVGIPAVTITVNPEVVEVVQRHLLSGPLTIVAAEEEFGNRMRAMYGDLLDAPEQIRLVRASDAAAVAALDPAEPVMLTRAARRVLGPSPRLTMLVPHSPTISPQTAREILSLVIRMNVEAATAG
jgi:DNA-binding transcriptional regulator YhcF (GntR family)